VAHSIVKGLLICLKRIGLEAVRQELETIRFRRLVEIRFVRKVILAG